MSEVKKTDHSADVLASIKSQVPTVVDKYLGTKLDDALLKILERHTADLIEKYSVLPGPKSIKNQESEKSPKEIIRIKREQGEEKQDSTYSIRSTDKMALKEFDLKSALFKHMNKNKTANRNPANYHLYHALMEALIVDEDAMDKEVAVKDEGYVSDLEDTDNAHIPKVSTTTWFKPILKGERPATPEPECVIKFCGDHASKEDYDIGSFHQWFCIDRNEEGSMDECHKLLTNKVDLGNPEGHQILQNIYEPLPLGGPPGQVTIQPQFFFNKDLDYLLTGLKVKRFMNQFGYGYHHGGLEEREFYINKLGYNYLREDLILREKAQPLPRQTRLVFTRQSNGIRNLSWKKAGAMLKTFICYEYNKVHGDRKWSEDDKRRSKDFITAIEKRLQIRRIFQSLESFVGGRIRDIDYRLINRTRDDHLVT
ncbi:hypothetical protein Tco_1420890 [Tanacetum coccineum]